MDLSFQLEKMRLEQKDLIDLKAKLPEEFSDCVLYSRNIFNSVPKNCNQKIKTLSHDIESVIINNENNPEKNQAFVNSQTRRIKENAEKLSVAPSEGVKWVNWYSDLFLEEKLFPY